MDNEKTLRYITKMLLEQSKAMYNQSKVQYNAAKEVAQSDLNRVKQLQALLEEKEVKEDKEIEEDTKDEEEPDVEVKDEEVDEGKEEVKKW